LLIAKPEHGTVRHGRVVVGRNAVDLDITLTEEIDAVVAGDLALELEMPLADHGVFGGIDDLAVALASEGDGVHRVAKSLFLRLTLGKIAFAMLDGDGHGRAR